MHTFFKTQVGCWCKYKTLNGHALCLLSLPIVSRVGVDVCATYRLYALIVFAGT